MVNIETKCRKNSGLGTSPVTFDGYFFVEYVEASSPYNLDALVSGPL